MVASDLSERQVHTYAPQTEIGEASNTGATKSIGDARFGSRYSASQIRSSCASRSAFLAGSGRARLVQHSRGLRSGADEGDEATSASPLSSWARGE